jgi:hypothetical protein
MPFIVSLLVGAASSTTLWAQPTNRSQLFYDDFEIASHSSAYTIAQQQASNSLAVLSVPNPAELGSWHTYDQADGDGGLFGVQVTYNVDTPYTGNYQGTNVLRILRSPVGAGSATCGNFVKAQIGGKVRATWKLMFHPSSTYECMVHFSGTQSPGSEGFDTAVLSFCVNFDGSLIYYQGGWNAISGVTATPNIWQDYEIDVDLDAQTWTITVAGVTSSQLPFGNAPGNTAASITFRGGSSNNDLFYVDLLQVFPIFKPIGVSHTPAAGGVAESGQPVLYTLENGFNGTTNLNLDTNSIQLSVNGTPVTPQVAPTSNTNITTVSYLPVGGWVPSSSNYVQLTFSDTESPPQSVTNIFGFTVLMALANNPPKQQDSSPEALLVVEAEDFDRNIPSVDTATVDSMSWIVVNSPAGYSGVSALQAEPETFRPDEGGGPMKVNVGSNVSNSPRVDYKVRFARTGTHWVWIRGSGKDTASDSIHIGLDGVFLNEPISSFPSNAPPFAYNWSRTINGSTASAVMVPSVGYHYLTFWMRENGFVFDKFLLTANGNYAPSYYDVGPAESPAGAVASYWRFEESSGVALDVDNDHPNLGTLLGGATRTNSVFGTPVPRTGEANTQSLSIPGTDGSAVDMGTNLDAGTGSFTLQGWINALTIPGGTAFIAGKHITSEFSNKGYELLASSSGGGFTVSAAISAGGSTVTATSGALTLGQWYHVAAVRSGGNLTLYVNGTSAASVPDSTSGGDLTSAQHFSVGGAKQVDGNFHVPFNGLIDEVRVTMAAVPTSDFLDAPLPTRPQITSQSPAPGSTGVPGTTNIAITLVNGTIQVVTNSIQLFLNNSPVTPSITQSNTTTFVTYQPPSALPGGSVNTVKVIYSDNGSPVFTVTNTYSFTVAYLPISGPSYWRFEEPSGTTALDSTGPFPGTLLSNAVRSADVPVATIPQTGAANTQSMSFDGTGSVGSPGTCVDMGPAIQVITEDFTMECWVKVTGTPNGNGLILGKLGTGLFSDKYFSLSHGGPDINGDVQFLFKMTGANSVASPTYYAQNQWHHIAGVRQGTTISIYVDGVLANSTTLNGFQDFTSDQHFCVGGGASGGVVNLQGLVDEARLTNKALSPAFFLNSPPPAIINFSLSGKQLILSWTASGFVLQQNGSLTNPAGWVNVPGGSTSPVMVTPSGAPTFYRLKQ